MGSRGGCKSYLCANVQLTKLKVKVMVKQSVASVSYTHLTLPTNREV